jgi:hypothetical protein
MLVPGGHVKSSARASHARGSAATDFFGLPSDPVIELGAPLEF